jgi:hypothetical protein
MPPVHGGGNTTIAALAIAFLQGGHMRASIASRCLLAISLVGCADGGPGSISAPASADVLLQQADVERPFTGSCTTTFGPTPFPLPPIHHQIDTGSCQLTHLGKTDFYGEQDINFAAGTQSGWRRWTAANGDELHLTHTGTSGLIAPGMIGFSAQMTIVGGTGRFAGATGSARGTGVANLAARSTSVTLEGWIKY